nr:type VI secretion system tube protein Hcp [uncultured Rhodopila sp.]
MPIYMNYDSLSVKGDVTATGWENWIELNSFQFGVGRGISSPTGGSADRESSAPSVSEITVTKDQDSSTGPLVTAALQGEGVTVIIDFVKTSSGQLTKYMEYKLTNTLISGWSTSSGGDRPSESISLNFTKIEVDPTTIDATGAISNASPVTYDIGLAKVV